MAISTVVLVMVLVLPVIISGGLIENRSLINKCRSRFPGMIFEDIDDFTNSMCTYCLYTIHHENAKFAWKRLVNWTINVEQWKNVILVQDPDDPDSPYTMEVIYRELLLREPDDLILKEFSNETYIDSFLKCCQDSSDCCQRMMMAPKSPDNYCPMLWDGWDCWLPAEPETVAEQTCPDMSMLAIDSQTPRCLRSHGQKQCFRNGTWNDHTNYRQCSHLAYETRLSVIKTTIVCQSISIFLILVSIIIFLNFRLYRKDRIQMHLNFFISILMSSIMSILYTVYVTDAHLQFHDDNDVLSDPDICRTFTFLFKDTRMMNYSWMLIEGIFFHNIVVFAFNKMSQWWKWIFPVGWIIPNVIMFSYAAVRIREDNDDCWIDLMGDYEWIFLFFPYLCFGINVILFLNLIRVILDKLVFTKHRYIEFARRGIKTSLLLIPIFGLQYVIHFIPIDPTETCDQTLICILHLQVIIEGLQGAIVAVILCFLDQDVYPRLIECRIFSEKGRSTTGHTTGTTTTTTTTSRTQSSSFSSLTSQIFEKPPRY